MSARALERDSNLAAPPKNGQYFLDAILLRDSRRGVHSSASALLQILRQRSADPTCTELGLPRIIFCFDRYISMGSGLAPNSTACDGSMVRLLGNRDAFPNTPLPKVLLAIRLGW